MAFPQITEEVLNFKLPPPEPKPAKVLPAPRQKKEAIDAAEESEDHEMHEDEEEKKDGEEIPTIVLDATKKRQRADFEGEQAEEEEVVVPEVAVVVAKQENVKRRKVEAS